MRIHRLKLFTNLLEEQKVFYTKTMGFKLLEESSEYFEVLCGASKLRFCLSSDSHIYHFAFNIPSLAAPEALRWLEARTDITKDGETALIDFVNWNAEAVYFTDPSGNILEFIARKNLNLPSEANFSIESVLNISEIGLPVLDVNAQFEYFEKEYGMSNFSGDKKRFCAVGDEEGLLIVVHEGGKKWYPTELVTQFAPFGLDASIGGVGYGLEFLSY